MSRGMNKNHYHRESLSEGYSGGSGVLHRGPKIFRRVPSAKGKHHAFQGFHYRADILRKYRPYRKRKLRFLSTGSKNRLGYLKKSI